MCRIFMEVFFLVVDNFSFFPFKIKEDIMSYMLNKHFYYFCPMCK